jgi:hypothetical protein
MNSKKNQQIETNCATCHVPWRDRRRATCSAWRSRPQTTSRRHLSSSSSSSFSSSAKKMRVVWSRCRRRRRETRKDIFFETTTTTTENNGSSFSWSSTQLNVRRVVRRASARQTEEKRRMTTCREGQLSDQIRQKTERIAFDDRFCVLGACLEYTTLETRVCGALKSVSEN